MRALQPDLPESPKKDPLNTSVPDWLQTLGQEDNQDVEESSDAGMFEPKIGEADLLESDTEKETSSASPLSDNNYSFERTDNIESKSEKQIQVEAELFDDDLSWLETLNPSKADEQILDNPQEETSERGFGQIRCW